MSRPENGDPAAAHSRAVEQSRELGEHVADLAERIAESEDRVASTLEESARLRPHAEERLRSAADEARRFAEKERGHSRALRRTVEDTDPD